MNKQALTIDPSVVGRHALGGALVGMSAASLIELAHSVALARREQKMRTQPTETDENTIVLTLPKQAEISGKAVVPVVESSKSGEFTVNRGQPQSRETGSGKYGPKLVHDKTASGDTGWPTLTASILAALAGLGGGAALVNKVVEKQRQERMQGELDQAKQEYMDLLSGKAVKGAETVEQMFGGFEGDLEKEAGDTFGMLNYPLAAMAILSILGTGATGYLTKRVLDEQVAATNKATRDIPKVKRIVFRSEPEADASKQASAEDCESAAAGLLVMMDRVGGTERFVGAPQVKQAMAKSGMTKQALINATQDWDKLVSVLDQDPDLRKALTRLYIDQTSTNPFSRFFKRMATSLPFVQRRADQKLYDAVNGVRFQGAMPAGAELPAKTAAAAGAATSLMTAGLVGSAISGERITKEELAQMIQEAQAENEANTPKPTKDVVQVQAQDPGAQTYVAKHGTKIQALLKRLAAEGQI